MQYFRPGSQLRQLITMLSIVGEYPIRSLYLLGNERAYKALVHKLTTPETFRIPQTETELTTRLLTVTGKGNSRSVRLYKGALPMANHELRTLRRTAHHYFDQLYESGYMSKQDAYQWLADLIMAPLSEAHIGHLGEYYCKQVIEESRKLLERRKAKTRGRYYAQKGGALAS